MTEPSDNSPSDELSEYLQAYLDETEEELETLVQALLTLEDSPRDMDALNEAFRMMHSLKGSSGLMGYEGIAELAHELENRFDQFREGAASIDRAVMDVMLDCLDFLRAFTAQLRAGESADEDGSVLIRRLEELETRPAVEPSGEDRAAPAAGAGHITLGGGVCVRVTFREGLQLADLKARLIVARLSNIGEIIGSEPPIDEVASSDSLPRFVVIVATDRNPQEVSEIASVDGVESVEILSPGAVKRATPAEEETAKSPVASPDADVASPEVPSVAEEASTESPEPPPVGEPDLPPETVTPDAGEVVPEEEPVTAEPASTGSSGSARPRVVETVRVDIDRLDRLMNLTGELVVTNARFHQISGEMSPALRNARGAGRISELSERLREGVERIRRIGSHRSEETGWQPILNELEQNLTALEDESVLWNEGRRCFSQMADAVDQLSRVSQNLQQGVLDTRMMPVGPLFGRFKRVIRDLSLERGKQVRLEIRGEKTELDKRMIDELGDPLLHLIRNSIDHGLESVEERLRAGKSETGTIVLEASHSGNNVFVSVRDDGAGIDVEKVRARIVERGLTDAETAAGLNARQVIDFIWHPGFSTAEQVTEISGRGVGMDIVKNRISELNGSVEVTSEPGAGTQFQLRLPLTLAIIRSLMVRFRTTFFSIPIDDVREIVSIPVDQVYSVHGRQTIEVRGEFVPLATMDRLFQWHGVEETAAVAAPDQDSGESSLVAHVVILQSRGKTLGLCVDELLGGSDIVIKSLADNFISIRGLSGASIMGEGTVCLMLDTTAIIEMMEAVGRQGRSH